MTTNTNAGNVQSSGSSLSSNNYGVPVSQFGSSVAFLLSMMDTMNQMQKIRAELQKDWCGALMGQNDDGTLNASKGLIQMTANATIQAGKDEAQADMASATGSIISGSFSFAGAAATFGSSQYAKSQAKGPQAELQEAKNYRDALQGKPSTDLIQKEPIQGPKTEEVTEKVNDKMADYERGIGIENFKAKTAGKNGVSEPDLEQQEINDAAVQQLRSAGGKAYKDALKKANEQVQSCESQVQRPQTEHQSWVQGYINPVSTTGSAAGSASGSILKMAPDTDKAKDNAESVVLKTVQDGVASNIQEQKQKADAAHQAADDAARAIASLAQSVVRA